VNEPIHEREEVLPPRSASSGKIIASGMPQAGSIVVILASIYLHSGLMASPFSSYGAGEEEKKDGNHHWN
jgi:hypothetical protein